MVGLTLRGYFAGSFINTFGDRTYAAGVARALTAGALGSGARYTLGYRLGGLYGYDSRLTWLAAKTPVIPLAQITVNAEWKRMGVQLGWSTVANVGFFVGL